MRRRVQLPHRPRRPHEQRIPVQVAVAALKSEHDCVAVHGHDLRAGLTELFAHGHGHPERRAANRRRASPWLEQGKPDMRYVRIGNGHLVATPAPARTPRRRRPTTMSTWPFSSSTSTTSSARPRPRATSSTRSASETVSGIAATHYRLADDYIQGIVANMPEMAAGGLGRGRLDRRRRRLARCVSRGGRRSVDKAQDQTGFDYTVTSLDCACPVTPPDSTGS